MARTAAISLSVQLDDSNVPTAIAWSADDAGFAGERPCVAMNLTMWDAEQKLLSAIGLWTKDTRLADMYAYLGQTLGQLADTCRRAAGDDALADRILACADEVAARASTIAPAEFERSETGSSEAMSHESNCKNHKREPISR